MDGGSLGRAMADAIAGLIIIALLVGVVIGAVLFLGVPWLWHFAAAHVAIH